MRANKITSAISIKLRFSNAIHRILEPNLDLKKSQRWRKQKTLTDKEKIELFDKIVEIHKESSEEYTKCLFDYRENKRLVVARTARGYYEKKRAKREQHAEHKTDVR
jgi:F0F1-type ATP synthase delta subunit